MPLPIDRKLIRGFTLIELLVVIGIIALLIAILLPTLRRARQTAEQVACLSNIKQLSVAFLSYSLDNKVIPGAALQGGMNLDWSGKSNAVYLANPTEFSHPIRASVLKQYIVSVGILTCPTAQLPNHYFDYTMVARLGGAKTNLPWRMSYPVHPEKGNSPRKYFDGIPILIEENQFFYNSTIDDGAFGNQDEFSHRHHGGCNVAYLDGSAGYFKPPSNPQGDSVQTAQDLQCNNFWLETSLGNFFVGNPGLNDYRWANSPH